MEERTESRYRTGNGVCDAFRFVCEASFAIWPRDVADKIGEFEKNLWGGVRWFADKNIDWIDAALKGGDRLREEWQRRGPQQSPPQPHVTDEQPGTV